MAIINCDKEEQTKYEKSKKMLCTNQGLRKIVVDTKSKDTRDGDNVLEIMHVMMATIFTHLK